MVKVSGVPYDVELPLSMNTDDMIATLEQENKLMRARMDRLEDELRVSNEMVIKQNIELINLQNKYQKLLQGQQ
jgi:hypothetical protein